MTQTRPLRARYIGYVKGTENHGDETLLWLIRDLLAPEIAVTLEDGPCELALLGGGTLINQSPWLLDVFEAALGQAGGGIVVGSGVGDLYFWGNHFDRWRPLLERCSHVGVRGPESCRLLERHGFSRALCVGDPYLWLHAPFEAAPVPRRLGINLGCTNNSLWGENEDDFLRFMRDTVRRLRGLGWTFSWISVWSKDLPILQALRRETAHDSPPVLDARVQSLEAYSALSQCDIFLGEKLHAIAMAAVAGVPFLALEYQPKVRDFAESLGMESWTLSTAERETDRILERLEALRGDRLEAMEIMKQRRDRLRRDLRDFILSIKKHYGCLTLSEADVPTTDLR